MNVVLIKHDGNYKKYLFAVPSGCVLHQMDRVVVDTCWGAQQGTCAMDSAELPDSALPILCMATGAKLPLKRVTGLVHIEELHDVEAVPTSEPSTFDWDGFRSGKFAVNCKTEENAKAFLAEARSLGMKRTDGRDNGHLSWEWYKSDTAYRSNIDGIGFCFSVWYKIKGIPVIPYPAT